MKTFAFRGKDYNFTADLWTFTEVTDASGASTPHYSFSRTIKLLAVTGMFGKMTVFFQESETDIQLKDQIMRLKDAAGVELNPGYVWSVDQFVPYINTWGNREGFKGRLTFVAVNS